MERIPHVVAPAWTLQGDIKTQPGMANVLTAEANRRETLVFNLHLNVSHQSKLTLNGKTENRDVNSSAQAFKLLFVFCFLSPACFMTRGHSYPRLVYCFQKIKKSKTNVNLIPEKNLRYQITHFSVSPQAKHFVFLKAQ